MSSLFAILFFYIENINYTIYFCYCFLTEFTNSLDVCNKENKERLTISIKNYDNLKSVKSVSNL